MKVDGYTVESYITNITTGERLPYDTLSDDEKLKAEEVMIRQMVKAIGCEILSLKKEDP